jgi:hypothetical protein
MTGDLGSSVTFIGSSKLSCNATDEFRVTAVFVSKRVTGSNGLRVTEPMNESSQFTQVNDDKKGGLVVGDLWALIVGSILALLLICGLIIFVMMRKRRSTEPTELSQDAEGQELDGMMTLAEDEFFISQYGLSVSDEQSSDEGEVDTANFLESVSDGYILEDTGDNIMSEYGFSDDLRDTAALTDSDEAASGGDTDYDDSNIALGYSDDKGKSGGGESDGDAGHSEEPVAGRAADYSCDDDSLDFAQTHRLSDDRSGFE